MPSTVSDLANSVRSPMTDRFGPATGGWCDELPSLIAALCSRWQLETCDT